MKWCAQSVKAVGSGAGCGGPAGRSLLIGLGQVGEEDAPGDAVHGQVVGGQEELGTGFAGREQQHRTQERAGGRVEGGARGFGGGHSFGVGIGGTGVGGQFVAGYQSADRTGDRFLAPAVFGPREARPQRRVRVHHRRQGPLQRRLVQIAREVEQHRHGEVAQRAVRGEEPLVHRGQRRRAVEVRPCGGRCRGAFGRRGEVGDRLVPEHVAGAEVQACGAGSGDGLDAEDRVAAQLEEVVGDPHPRHAQDLGPDSGEGLLLCGAGGGELPLGLRFDVGGGQGTAVEFAAGGQRQRGKRGEGGRHHVLGQHAPQRRPQLRGRRHGAAGRRHRVRRQPRVAAGVGHGRHRGRGDLRQVQQRRLDLAGLDAVAAHLDLVVGAPEIVQAAVGGPARQVAGAVHAGSGRPERVGEEARRGQTRAAGVAARDLLAGQEQLAADAGGHRAQPGVQHIGPHVGQRPAHQRPVGVLDPAGQRVHGALGGTVEVVRGHAGVRGEFAPQAGADRLAAEHQDPGTVPRVGQQPGGQQLPEVGRGHVQEVDAVPHHVLDQRRRVHPGRLVHQVQPVAVGHQQDAFQRGVEGERRGQRDPQRTAPGVGDEARAVRGQQVRRRAVRHHDALGPAGRAGGVDDVGGVRRVQRGDPVGVGRIGVGRIGVDQIGVRAPRRDLAHRRLVEHQRRPGVRQQVAHALVRQRGIQRQVRRAGLPDGQDRHDHVGGARQTQRDQPLGPGAPRDQMVREPVGAGVERRVVQLLVPGDERRGCGARGGPALEQLQARGVLDRERAAVPLPRHLADLGLGEQVQRAQRAVRLGGGAGQQPQQLAGHPLGGRGLEQVAAVFQQPGQSLAVRHELHAQIEGGGLPGHLDRGDPQPVRRGGGRGRRVQQDHDVEQRVAAGLARCADRLHQALERRVAIGEGIVDGLCGGGQQVMEGP